MNYLLRLKHWELFFILTSTIFISFIISVSHFKIGTLQTFQLVSLLRIIGIIIFFGWLLILGLSLNEISENPYRFNTGLFAFAVIVSAIGYINMNLQVIFSGNHIIPQAMSILLTPLTLFGIIYTFYNLPKSLKSLESNKIVGFGEFVGELLLLLIFSIGTWFTQPRISHIFQPRNNDLR
jgi:hypothetical protein